MREIILDTETTGLDINDGHRVIEIGAVEVYNKKLTGRRFQVYINPGRNVSTEAYQVHGISTEFLQNKPTFKQIAEQFLEFIKDATLVIHNAAFDLKFLNYELSLFSTQSLAKHQVVDTLELARRAFPGQRANLDALCRRFDIDTSKRNFHGALLDAQLLAQVYLALTITVEQFSFNLESTKQKSDKMTLEYMQASGIRPRIVLPSCEELDKHRAFLEKITNPVWTK